MLSFLYRFIFLFSIMISCVTTLDVSAQTQKGYLEGLFEEIEAREKKPEELPPRLYKELIKGALSFKLLEKYPKLRLGRTRFSSELPSDLKGREADLKKGQDFILNDLATPNMFRDSLTFKELIDQIDRTFEDPQSKLHYVDWVLMANAFRTLSAPDSKAQVNALGVFVTEYIILMLINELEKKTDRTKEDSELLSTLYYILSQIYQNIINNPEKYHFVQKKKEKKSSPLYFALPKAYYTDVYYEDRYIEPITSLTIYHYEIPYHDPYSYAIFVSFDVTYDILLSRRLDLLRTAVIVTPYYDVAWVPIIEYVSIDLRSPFYLERLTPVFWDDYFPYGVIGIEPVFIDRLYNRWERIRKDDPRAIRQAINPSRITNSLREMRSPEWRRKQERKQEQELQERRRRVLPEERPEGRRLREERQEQRRLQQEQEKFHRKKQREGRRLREEKQEQRRLQQEQEKLHREKQREERRLREEKQEQRRLQQEQEKLHREKQREERRLREKRQEQRRLQQEQEKLHREKQKEERGVESRPAETKREPHPPKQKIESPRSHSEEKGGDAKKPQKGKNKSKK